MLLLRALLLWSLVAVHVAAGAVLFRRLFPRESAWFGLVVPAFTLCVALNFLEHFIALPSLLGLLPVTTIGSIFLLARPNFDASWRRGRLGMDRFVPATADGGSTPFSWNDVRLPLGVFLVSFAFTFLIRCLSPTIQASSDGLADLNLIANFCQGGTLPPVDGWLPPFKLQYYYTFQHYAASVLTRLLNVDLGTGYNLSHAFLSALICLAASAAAWRLTGRTWIALVMPLLIEGAATGSSAYLWLTESDPSPWSMSNLSGGLEHPDSNPIWRLLATAPYRERLELQVPGFWTWRDEFHPNAGGHFFTLASVWMLFELARPERRNWPWIAAVLIPFLAILTSTWALPLTALLCGGGLALAWAQKNRPENTTFVWVALALGGVSLWPTLLPLFNAPEAPTMMWTKKEWHTPLDEFLIQWWPVYVPWLALLAVWPKLPPALKWVHAVVPLMYLGIEDVNIEDGRYNTIEKMWGSTFGAGLVALFPAVAMRRGIAFRVITLVLIASAVVSLQGWLRGTLRWTDWAHDAWHLEGTGSLRNDALRARLLEVLSPLHKATILTGKVIWDYNESPALATFSGNRCYIAWTTSEERYGHKGESDFRADQVNSFYAGTQADPLGFLLAHDIAAVVIWPEDQIPDALLATFKQQLGPRYDYVDCRGDGPNNAGVFMRRGDPAANGAGAP